MTRHQLNIQPNEPPDKVILDTIRVASGNGNLTNIPTQNCIFETSNSDQEYHDLLFFEVADGWVNRHLELPYFAKLEGFVDCPREVSRLYGCPFLPVVMEEYLETFEVGTVGTIHLKTVLAGCEYNASYRSSAEYYRHYLGGPIKYNVDGISGGPLYSLIERSGGFEFVLDGIIVCAGKGNVYIVDADYMVKVLCIAGK